LSPLAQFEEQSLTDTSVPQSTAGIHPERFSDHLVFAKTPKVAAVILGLFILIGFGLRMNGLGVESLGEDEFNKLQTARDYRANGLSGKNGEHPFLMKGLQTLSLAAADRMNAGGAQISDEAALRFPVALFGTFTVLLIFLLVSELFGRSIGLIAGVLWAVEPLAVGFDRIAKEDSLALFFFLLCGLFWIKSQTKAERGEKNWIRYIWLAGMAFAALMASKYYPFFFSGIAAYYAIFQILPSNRWALGQKRWLMLFVVMGVTFLILNPTIVLTDTWREMLKFSSEGRIGHDSYEFMGRLYSQKLTAWLNGVPWTFYYILIAIKSSLSTLLLFLIGLPLLFRRRMGDGRFFIAFWAFYWFMPYTFLGGKFTRYFTMAEPIILIGAAVGLYYLLRWVTGKLGVGSFAANAVQVSALLFVVAVPLANSLSVAPHYRLYTNAIGTAFHPVSYYFPHDDLYDTSTRDVIADIAANSPVGITVACETPTLFEYYAQKAGRHDFHFVSFSDTTDVQELKAGDVVVHTVGRRYVSNREYFAMLETSSASSREIKIGDLMSSRIYVLDGSTAAALKELASR
jgi:hypothetical protein